MPDIEERIFQKLKLEYQNTITFQRAGLLEQYASKIGAIIVSDSGDQQYLDSDAGFFYQSRYSEPELQGHLERIHSSIGSLILWGFHTEGQKVLPINFSHALKKKFLGDSIDTTTSLFVKRENVKSIAYLLEELFVTQESLQYYHGQDHYTERIQYYPIPVESDFDIKKIFIGRPLDEILDYDFFGACQKHQIQNSNLERESTKRINLLNIWFSPMINMINRKKRILTEEQKKKFTAFQSRVIQARKYIVNNRNIPEDEKTEI